MDTPPKLEGEPKPQFVQIAYITGCSAAGVAVLFGIFSEGKMWPAAFAVAALAALGIFLGYFAARKT